MDDRKHLGSIDNQIWEEFLAKYKPDWDQVRFDVLCGCGDEPPADMPENFARMVHCLTCKRIDVLATKDGQETIVEVKPDAGLGAIGQLLGYQFLYCEEYNQKTPPALLLVTDSIDDDTLAVAHVHGIEVVCIHCGEK